MELAYILTDYISLSKTVLPAARELKTMMTVGYDLHHCQPSCYGFLVVHLTSVGRYLTANPSISCETGLISFRTIFMFYQGHDCVHLYT